MKKSRKVITLTVDTEGATQMNTRFDVSDDAKKMAVCCVLSCGADLARAYNLQLPTTMRRLFRYAIADELIYGRHEDGPGFRNCIGPVLYECTATNAGESYDA